MKSEYIFVYGTLRQHADTDLHAVLVDHCKKIADGYIQGRLYDVGDYPGAVESGHKSDRVFGELYEIISGRKSLLSQLDAYEGCTDQHPQPHEYIRKKIAVRLVDGRTITAWVFLFNFDVSCLTYIESGDYTKFKKNSGAYRS